MHGPFFILFSKTDLSIIMKGKSKDAKMKQLTIQQHDTLSKNLSEMKALGEILSNTSAEDSLSSDSAKTIGMMLLNLSLECIDSVKSVSTE